MKIVNDTTYRNVESVENVSKTRIMIGMPSTGVIKSDTVASLFGAMVGLSEYPTMLAVPNGCYIHQLREFLANMSLEQGATHLMFIDSDMVFQPDAIIRLLKWDKDIIGADYHYKLSNGVSVTKLKVQDAMKSEVKVVDGVKQYTMEKPNEPIIVDAVGTGFVLIKTSVFEKIPKPWFWFDIKDGQLIGEDVYFCRKAAEHGIEVWCDPTINIGHLGEYIY